MYLKSVKKDDNTICDTYMQITYSAPTLFCTFFVCISHMSLEAVALAFYVSIHTFSWSMFPLVIFHLNKKSADFARFTSNGGK